MYQYIGSLSTAPYLPPKPPHKYRLMLPILLVTANPPRVYTIYTLLPNARISSREREREGEVHLTYVERGNGLRYLEIYNARSIVVVSDYYWARTIARGDGFDLRGIIRLGSE